MAFDAVTRSRVWSCGAMGSLLCRTSMFPLASASSLSSFRKTSVLHRRVYNNQAAERKKPSKAGCFEDIIKPVTVPIPSTEFGGVEGLAKLVEPAKISKLLNEFCTHTNVRQLAEENGLNPKMFLASFSSFRTYCLTAKPLDPAIAVTFSDIAHGGKSVESLYAYFLDHAKKVYPHLAIIDDLRTLSDLTQPQNWFPEARKELRKIVYHSGPTNSGKTFNALRRFREASSGVYCGPLRLLASEVFFRTNAEGVPCDMVTGEERRYAVDNMHPAAHLSSTIEMLATTMEREVAVIDEIQMLRDEQRGWSWTRALLGVNAKEVHLCGEASAIPIVRELLDAVGEHVEVFEYERKSPLVICESALGSLDNVQAGDCIVCFSKADIFDVKKRLNALGIQSAVIYGDLPPGTKLAQASKFNDPEDPTNVLVATDAVGMGLNLNIRRIIFHSVRKPSMIDGKMVKEWISTPQALQVAGRAGRYGSIYEEGKVMALHEHDNVVLKKILRRPIEPIERVGIAPTFEQLESFSYHMPKLSFVELLDVFVSLCSITDRFFICTVNEIRKVAVLIEHITLPIKTRFVLCACPLDVEKRLDATFIVKAARRFSVGQPMTFDWLCETVGWPLPEPKSIADLVRLEGTYDVVSGYLWLSFRFPEMVPDEPEARQLVREIDSMIEKGIVEVIQLMLNADNARLSSERKKQMQRGRTMAEKADFERTSANNVSDDEPEEVSDASSEEPHGEKEFPRSAAASMHLASPSPESANKEKIPLRLPEKRKGKKKSISETFLRLGLLNHEQLQQLRAELRKEEIQRLRKKS